MMPIPEIWDNSWAVLRAYWYFRRATELGSKVRVWGKPSVRNKGKMIVGNRVRLISTIATTELVSGDNGLLKIGDGTIINYGCSIAATQLIQFGIDCSIGTHVLMMDNDFHHIEPERRNERPESSPIILEDNVWVGGRAIILRGVTIGHDSVIGAGSVVARSIPPRSVAMGFPARVIRTF